MNPSKDKCLCDWCGFKANAREDLVAVFAIDKGTVYLHQPCIAYIVEKALKEKLAE